MLIDLKAHYLDLIVKAIEAGGNACLHRPHTSSPDSGTIYATKDAEDTSAEYVLNYSFGVDGFSIHVEFRDERPALHFNGHYVDGLEPFFPAFSRALFGNRLPDKSHEPEHVVAEYEAVAARGRPARNELERESGRRAGEGAS